MDREIFKNAGEQGFLMVWPDEKYGGMGDWDFRYEQIIIEEQARAGCAMNGMRRCIAVWSDPISAISAMKNNVNAFCRNA